MSTSLKCVICIDNLVNTMITNCRHICCCSTCIAILIALEGELAKCPKCRQQIQKPGQSLEESYIEIYLDGVEDDSKEVNKYREISNICSPRAKMMELGKRWKNLPEEEKLYYSDLADIENNHSLQMA